MYLKINTNNDSLHNMIRHNIAILSGFTIASSEFSGISDGFLPYLNDLVDNFKKLFEEYDKVENELFYLRIDEVEDVRVNILLVNLQKAMRLLIMRIQEYKTYSAHVAAVYVLSVFCICPCIIERHEVYDFLLMLRSNYII